MSYAEADLLAQTYDALFFETSARTRVRGNGFRFSSPQGGQCVRYLVHAASLNLFASLFLSLCVCVCVSRLQFNVEQCVLAATSQEAPERRQEWHQKKVARLKAKGKKIPPIPPMSSVRALILWYASCAVCGRACARIRH